MGFEGKTNLHDTKAEHNHTNSPHQTENEIGQIVDYLNAVSYTHLSLFNHSIYLPPHI